MKKILLTFSICVLGINSFYGQTCTIALTSVTGSDAQTIGVNTAIENITYSVEDAGSLVEVKALPPGVTAAFSTGAITISGVPTTAGIYSYTINIMGTSCANTSITGVITVN